MAVLHSEVKEVSVAELNAMTARMLGYIFPNTPVTDEEKYAFDSAVLLQIQHEKALKASRGEIPDGVSSFSIGHFSMTFADEKSASSKLTRKTICDASYGLLLRAGLLYRGVERMRGGCCVPD